MRQTAARLPTYKRRRILWTEEDVRKHYQDENGGFTKRQLQDTQYASRLAGEYLGLLYGGVIDTVGKRRVQVSSGAVTGLLRREWDLNGVIPSLPDSPARQAPEDINLDKKLRTDHRHHAVDAIVIALTDAKRVRSLSDAAKIVDIAQSKRQEVKDSAGRRRSQFAEIDPPWGTKYSFFDDVKAAVAKVCVSHRPEHKLNGPLHEGTEYSKPFRDKTGKDSFRTRRALTALKENEVAKIVDVHVREAVNAKLNGGDPKKVFASEANLPVIGKTPDGKPVKVKSVRIDVSAKPVTIRDRSGGERRVKPGSNHHMTIVAQLKADGSDREWVAGELVSRLDAVRRHRDRQPIVQHPTAPCTRLVFSLRTGDLLRMTRPNQPERLYVVRAISKSESDNRKPTYRIEYVSAVDARKQGDIKPPKRDKDAVRTPRRTRAEIDAGSPNQWFGMTTIDELREYGAQKVVVIPLGAVIVAND